MASLAFPNNPVNGQIYTGPNSVRYQYRSSAKTWTTTVSEKFTLEGANPSATAPLNPVNGTFWLDTDTKSLFVYHTATSQWLAVATGTSSSSDVSGLSLEGSAVYDGTVVLEDVGVNLELLPAT